MNFLNINILIHFAFYVEKYAYEHEKPLKMILLILRGFIGNYDATLFSFKLVSRERLKKIANELMRRMVIVT